VKPTDLGLLSLFGRSAFIAGYRQGEREWGGVPAVEGGSLKKGFTV